jgi:hypothetical protein
MREFNISLGNIFNGLDPNEATNKSIPSVSECLNLVPLGNAYKLHKLITDINSSVPESTVTQSADVWKDHVDDYWTDNGSDVWKDNPDLD